MTLDQLIERLIRLRANHGKEAGQLDVHITPESSASTSQTYHPGEVYIFARSDFEEPYIRLTYDSEIPAKMKPSTDMRLRELGED